MPRPQDLFRYGARSRRLIPFLLLAQRSEHASSSKRHQEENVFVSFKADRSEELSGRLTEEGEQFCSGAQAISNRSSIPLLRPPPADGTTYCARKAPASYTAVVITTTKSFVFYSPEIFSLPFSLDSRVALPIALSGRGNRTIALFFFYVFYLSKGKDREGTGEKY